MYAAHAQDFPLIKRSCANAGEQGSHFADANASESALTTRSESTD